MKYSDSFVVFVVNRKIVEIGIYNPSYTFMDIIKVGSSIEDVKRAGLPITIEKYIEGEPKDGVLYTDYYFIPNQYYYTMPDRRIKLLFNNNKVAAIYIFRKNANSFISNYNSKDALGNTPKKIVDKTDYPFVFDGEVIGRWKGINFVKQIDDFSPDNSFELTSNEFIFKYNSTCSYTLAGSFAYQSSFRWTKGIVIDFNYQTASKYVIKDIKGSKYMFLQWKTGDYTVSGMKPFYYVLKKIQH